ncbi:zf-TFIIB domain-containing protein [Undibacterium amnicola]|uniref:Zf-TFIIB domain-containing protein n=1 Tax=Undibacterium amnicola TaxID=1834038 RepID=A0ABR6XK93_9BURK|nr:zf-TFIIB domain-containing protein [Undibacterium amnicola]MBC3829935.1 zf-TFIIB domain-containing protein [Undibacterium amnicola]
MKCPVCENTNLLMSERQGIEIDYCPQCRGVWLDRGELDKIIERSGVAAPATATDGRAAVPATAPVYPTQAIPQQPIQHQHQQQQSYPQPTQHYSSQHKHQSSHTYPQHHHGGHYKKKKEGFLSDLFDFD